MEQTYYGRACAPMTTAGNNENNVVALALGPAGVTYLPFSVLTSPKKNETAVHYCDPGLSLVIMLVSRNVFHASISLAVLFTVFRNDDHSYSWSVTGIPADNQGSDKMYLKTPRIHKGHLVPAETYSFSEGHLGPTFTYSNAVPQYGTFNSGQWAEYEKKIRNYANNKCSTKQVDLYLLPGLSEVTIQQGHGNSIKTLKPKLMRKFPKVVIPNSMWTAGCCVRGTRVFGYFAVIGNNVSYKENTLRDAPSGRRPTGKHNW